jgi:predicted transcriptional regulator
MLLTDVIQLLGCEAIDEKTVYPSLVVTSCFAADLMSEVLAFCGAGALLLTGLTNIQSVHTADVADLSAILYVNAKRPPQPVIDLAGERGIPLLTTNLTMFEASGILYGKGLLPSSKE